MRKQQRNFLCLMAGNGSLQDLKELIEPVKVYFDGIVITYHGKEDDEEARYLESVKGRHGKIIYYTYHKRHNESRNQYLWCGPLKEGDWVCQVDVLERLSPFFADSLNEKINDFENKEINLVYYYGKPFLFKYHESLRYVGSPHEGLIREDGQGNGIEFSKIMPDEKEVRLNVRPLKRKDPLNFVEHYLKYYLFPWGSNHCLLGLEKNGNPRELFPIREQLRLEFREYWKTLTDLPLETWAIKSYMVGTVPQSIPEKFKEFCRKEKILNDCWRLWVLKDENFKDTHNFKDVVEIK